eukprot:3620655-Rhodomonas_salina.1
MRPWQTSSVWNESRVPGLESAGGTAPTRTDAGQGGGAANQDGSSGCMSTASRVAVQSSPCSREALGSAVSAGAGTCVGHALPHHQSSKLP